MDANVYGLAVGIGLGVILGSVDGRDFTRAAMAALDRVERGEAVAEIADPIGWRHMDAEQRAALRAGLGIRP